MIKANNITWGVRGRDLISGVSLSLSPGKLYLIIGPNGAGKSTLIKILAGFIRPAEGTVEYENLDIQNVPIGDLAKQRAVLSQAVEAPFPLTVREVVMMGRSPHFGMRPGAHDAKIVDELMQSFEVAELSDRNYQTLSGGERQRVNFARVLAQLWHSTGDVIAGAGRTSSPLSNRYLFLDEPLTFLDIRHQIEFMKKIREFADSANAVTLGVVHDLNLGAHFADEIIMVNEGRVVSQGSPSEVLTHDNLQNIFGIHPKFLAVKGTGVHIVFD